jgi:hypothetical protein
MTTVCFDFDGVLAEYSGWKGHEHIGEPIESMIELVTELHGRGFVLFLCTTRLNDFPFADRPHEVDRVVQTGYAAEILHGWLQEQGIETYFSHIGCDKMMADYYIDDKALRFGGVGIDCGSAMYEGALDDDDIRRIIIKRSPTANHSEGKVRVENTLTPSHEQRDNVDKLAMRVVVDKLREGKP